MAGVLALAGWESKVRMGRRIWKKEDGGVLGGFRGWFSEQTAYLLAEREERGDA